MIPHILATLALIGVALLLGACAYESVVMAPNFEREIPASIEAARQFLKRTTPGHYFRILAPVTQLLLVAGVIMSWQVMAARWALLTALGVLLFTDAITFTYHYPRLAIMFRGPMPEDHALLARAAREWAMGNIVRVALLLVAFLAVLRAVLILPMHGSG